MPDSLETDRIAKLLNTQNALLNNLVGQVKTLVNIPSQVATVEAKLTFMANVHTELATLNADLNKVGTKVSNHSLVLSLLGACILTGLPILATWNYHLRSELTDLQRVTTQLEEQLRHERDRRIKETYLKQNPKFSYGNGRQIARF